MYVAILVHTKVGAYCGQGRKGKKNTREKLASGSRECLEKPEWMSCPKRCAHLDHTMHARSLLPRVLLSAQKVSTRSKQEGSA